MKKKILSLVMAMVLCISAFAFYSFGVEMRGCQHGDKAFVQTEYIVPGANTSNGHYLIIIDWYRCYECNTLIEDIVFNGEVGHSYVSDLIQHYHSGDKQHTYIYEYSCTECDYSYTETSVHGCSGDANGNGCLVPYNLPSDEEELY